MEEKQIKDFEEQKPTWKKVVGIVLNVLFYTFLAFLFLFAIANIAGKNKNKIANLFGYGFLNVVTDSMEGDKVDSLKVGDMIIVKLVKEGDTSALDKLEIEKSIITYYDYSLKDLSTHRLVDIIDDNGIKTYRTQGDRVEVDYPTFDYVQELKNTSIYTEDHYASDILAVYTGTRLKGFGKVLNFLQSSVGFITCLIVPCALLLGFEVFLLVRNIVRANNAKMQEEMANSNSSFDAEAERERIRQELMKEMQQQNQQPTEEVEEKKKEPEEGSSEE